MFPFDLLGLLGTRNDAPKNLQKCLNLKLYRCHFWRKFRNEAFQLSNDCISPNLNSFLPKKYQKKLQASWKQHNSVWKWVFCRMVFFWPFKVRRLLWKASLTRTGTAAQNRIETADFGACVNSIVAHWSGLVPPYNTVQMYGGVQPGQAAQGRMIYAKKWKIELYKVLL